MQATIHPARLLDAIAILGRPFEARLDTECARNMGTVRDGDRSGQIDFKRGLVVMPKTKRTRRVK